MDGELEDDDEWFTVPTSLLKDPMVVEQLVEFQKRADDPQPLQYDFVIRALGWNHNTSVYTKAATPMLQFTGSANAFHMVIAKARDSVGNVIASS